MKVIFGTTNERKVEDLRSLSDSLNIDLEILTLNKIGWDEEEIEETGKTLEENSLIKAQRIYEFCKKKGIEYPIITDDAGLYVDVLNGKPGIYTGRYGDEEREKDPSLPIHQCIIKLLKEMEGIENRNAVYRCVVTLMFPNGSYIQENGESKVVVTEKIECPPKKPYFYSIVRLRGKEKAFGELSKEELIDTYRFQGLKKILKHLK